MIFSRNLVIVLVATIVSFSTLYTPQPILPLLVDAFGISPGDAGLLITVTLLPLAIAPIVYGYFLQAIPARLMLIVAFTLLIVDQLLFYYAVEYWHLLVLRLFQGFLLPAIFTALMTFCSTTVSPALVRRAMGFYIGSTIIGGFIGRLAGGFFASFYEWQTAFVVMGLIQIIPLALIITLKSDTDINFSRLDIKSVSRVLARPGYRYMFLALASVFFVFSGVLNVIPFHVQDLDASISPLLISMLYLGYLVGAPVSFFAEPLSRKMKSDHKGMVFGLVLHAIGLISFLFVSFQGLVLMMFFFSAGFFLIHSMLSGLVNHLASEHKGVVNGLYVSIYYFSGALGSWLPAYFYVGLGWNGMLVLFGSILCVSLWSIGRFRSIN